MTLEKVSESLCPSALRKKSRDSISTVCSVMFVQAMNFFEKGSIHCHGFAYLSLLHIIVSFRSGTSVISFCSFPLYTIDLSGSEFFYLLFEISGGV